MSEERFSAGYCPSCGERTSPGWSECYHCGARLDDARSVSTPRDRDDDEAYRRPRPPGKPRLPHFQPRDEDDEPRMHGPTVRRYSPTKNLATVVMFFIGLSMLVDGLGLLSGAVRQARGDFVTGVPDIAGTTWTAWENGRMESYTFEKGGTLRYTLEGQTFRNGTWAQNGDEVTFEINQGFRRFEGTLDVNEIIGESWNADGERWQTDMTTTQLTGLEIFTPSLLVDMGIGCLALLVLIPTAVLFLIWFYRAHANLEPLGARNLQFSPGWAVGWWFIPFLNLVLPYLVAQEIWKKSDPDVEDEEGAFHPRTGPASVLVGLWWAAWLLGGVVAIGGGVVGAMAETPQALKVANGIEMATHAISILTGVLVLLVIRGIQNRQAARHAALERVYGE